MTFCSPTHLASDLYWTHSSDQFTIVKSVGEHKPSLSPSPKIFVRFSLPPGISMSGLEKNQSYYTSINSEIDRRDDGNVLIAQDLSDALQAKIFWGILTL